MMVNQKLGQIRTAITELGIDGFLVSSEHNRRYLSNFTGSAGYLLITVQDALLITDFRYVEQAGNQSEDFRVIRMTGSDNWLPPLLIELQIQRLGFEGQYMTYASHKRLQDLIEQSAELDTELVPVSDVVEDMRSIKDDTELGKLTRAIEIADSAFAAVSNQIGVGQSEREIAWQLEKAMRELGAESISFDTIVAFGPNAALPHHRPSDDIISEGQPLIIDMGARYQGYCSDLSRTLCLGQPDGMFRKIYDVVLGAQLTAIATVEAGMTGGEADNLARTVIEQCGYGDNFGHSLGHGVGLEVHERPGVGPNSSGILTNGMVFTIEPGIYISGWGGVRIEDVVMLVDGKSKLISNAPKQGILGG